jgi:hypothetical protein
MLRYRVAPIEEQSTCPLPEDPALAEMAGALRDAGYWAEIVDRDWRWRYMTDDLRFSYGGLLEHCGARR